MTVNDRQEPERPVRVQLSRAKGWRMPPNTVKVDRSTKWGNPWTVADCDGSAAEAVRMFRSRFIGPLAGLANHGSYIALIAAEIGELRGKNLACWCALDAPCHADTLLELANH